MWIDAGISLQFLDFVHGFNRIKGNLHIHIINGTNGQPFIIFRCVFVNINLHNCAGLCIALLQFSLI